MEQLLTVETEKTMFPAPICPSCREIKDVLDKINKINANRSGEGVDYLIAITNMKGDELVSALECGELNEEYAANLKHYDNLVLIKGKIKIEGTCSTLHNLLFEFKFDRPYHKAYTHRYTDLSIDVHANAVVSLSDMVDNEFSLDISSGENIFSTPHSNFKINNRNKIDGVFEYVKSITSLNTL